MKTKTLFSAILLIFTTFLFSQVINVPVDQPTIQAGIDIAFNGDTVLVAPGTYVENINFNGKNITVASQFLVTHDPIFISQTVIDGDSLTSVVTFENGEDSTAVLIGFTITNGAGTELSWPWGGTSGGGLYIAGASPSIKNLIIINNNSTNGAGFYCDYSSNLLMDSVLISLNTATESGGGIYCSSSGACFKSCRITKNKAFSGGGVCSSTITLDFKNVTITENIGRNGGGIYCGDLIISDSINRCNIYHNYALIGNDIYSSGILDIKLDTFSVLFPTDYHAYPPENITFDILNGKIEQVDADLYVSPNGNNMNSGLSIDNPLKNIRYAFSKILAGENNPHSIFLANGTYSPSATGEVYPLNIPDYISLFGQSKTATFLDGEWTTSVIRMFGNTGSQIKNLTITNGQGGSQPTGGAPYFYAGGISCEDNSNPVIQNVSVSGNYGGITCVSSSSPTIDSLIIEGNEIAGLYLQWGCNSIVTNAIINENAGSGILCSYSDPVMENIIITNNTSHGIWCTYSSPVLKNIVITNNTSYNGGGMHCYANSYPSLENVTIAFNSAVNEGGGIHCEFNAKPVFNSENRCNIYLNEAEVGNDYYAEVPQDVVVDTFTVINPSSYHAFPISDYSFDILNSKTNLVDADLWISPEGNNTNSGLNQDNPLRNIEYAFSVIMANSTHQNTIHLLEGIYSSSTNGESFPVNVLDYTNLIGVSEEEVILDAEGQSTVMIIKNNLSNNISNFTVTNGQGNNSNPTTYSGGITFYNSIVSLSNITVQNNACGGISCLWASPELENISIINNGQIWNGGGLYINGSGSNPVLKNILISGNQSDNNGGGIYCSNHANPTMMNVTISNNSATVAGGGIYSDSYLNPDLFNSILWNNSPSEIYGLLSITYSDIQGGWEGEGNIDEDPLFVGFGDHPYALSDDSPCINAGTIDTIGLNLPEFDLAGNLRIKGGRVDMGTYENQNVITAISTRLITDALDLSCKPNPFADELTIIWSQPELAYTKIAIFNTSGKRIKELVSGIIPKGKQKFYWEAGDLQPGVYYIQLQVDNNQSIKKLLKL